MIPSNLETILLKVQKPAQYIGGELHSVIKDKNQVDCRLAFCFPDKYEVGMSHLGMKILYSLYNSRDDLWCERVFAPDGDMEALMRENNIPLYGLESLEPISTFDFILFTLQYEMSYTAILNMLDLAGLPIHSKDRTQLSPIVAAGGPCACNPEPIAEFIDLFFLGEGEEVNLEVTDLYLKAKKAGWSKEVFLKEAAKIQGVYVPSLYTLSYNADSTIKSVEPTCAEAPASIKKRVISHLDKVFYPQNFVVPYVGIVHDRAMLEVQRGCLRGCRFCQAGFIYRPLRDKHFDTLNADANALCNSTGYEEISLTSLSTSDYQELEPLLDNLLEWTGTQKVNLSLPSLRVDNFSKELMQKVSTLRKSSLTFAPEAGTQRLRDVINKNVTEEEVLETCKTAFEGGYTSVKLYFMMGLPTETLEDIEGIAILAQKVVDLYYSLPSKPKGKAVSVSVSCACFVPKPFTPFEFEPQDTMETLRIKQKHLISSVKSKKINVSYHDADTSFIEAVLARGDRRLGSVVELVWKKGARLDGWYEYFKPSRWFEAFEECGIDPTFYANRHREYEEQLPWDHLDYCVTKRFLIKENQLARQDVTTPHCRIKCAGCGANQLVDGTCCQGECQEFSKPADPTVKVTENTVQVSTFAQSSVETVDKEEPAPIISATATNAEPFKLRLFFSKMGRAKYISHLDMVRCVIRALKRSGLPIWYTEGFNPHMYLTFPLPISLGYEGCYECLDMKLLETVDFSEIVERVNQCLPEDIRIFSASEQIMDQKEIAWADYEVDLNCEYGSEDLLCTQLTTFLAADTIPVMKKTKKAPKEIDLKPLISLIGISPGESCVHTAMRFATGITVNINPSLLLDNMPSTIPVLSSKVKRFMVYNNKLEQFV